MSDTINMTVRVNRETKSEVESILKEIGLSTNVAINMFLRQIVRERAVPLTMAIDPMFTTHPVADDITEAQNLRKAGAVGVSSDMLIAEMDDIIDAAERKVQHAI